MTKPKLFVSFSGGETSALMTKLIHDTKGESHDTVTVFANTGQENNETLDFVKKCDDTFGWGVVWVEAVTHHSERRGCTHKVVNYSSASRKGEVFEEMINKYGIPNKAYPHCTRELKLNPMHSYIKSIGWARGDYDTAIGIRSDENRRVSKRQEADRIVYPCIDWMPITKEDVNEFWEAQPFRLDLKGYEGNCRWCWKKSLKKHIKLINDRPESYAFPARMERDKGLAGHNVDGTPRVFFRSNHSVEDLFKLANVVGNYNEPDRFDEDDGCSESCEVFQTSSQEGVRVQ